MEQKPLPLILAGPMVRRVDARTCSVFVALSSAATVELRVWRGIQFSSGAGTVVSGQGPLRTATQATRRFGQNLHAAAVAIDFDADPPVGLDAGTYHSYDIVVDGSRGLLAEGLLEDETPAQRLATSAPTAPLHLALGYETARLPGFVTPAASLGALMIAHGSCRRATFDGYDATAGLDDVMKAARNDPAGEWPQQLFLTGDQIYADDVGTSFLAMLMRLSARIMGSDESFPLGDNESESFALTPANFPPRRRGRIVRQAGGMTSRESRDHLLGFGEFAAMYLAVWSPRVWDRLGNEEEMFLPIGWTAEDEGPDGAEVRSGDPPTKPWLSEWEIFFEGRFEGWKRYELGGEFTGRKTGPNNTPLDAGERRKLEKRYPLRPNTRDELRSLVKFRSLVAKAARVLANCSTYMIWDDHDVTDDWNLCGRWMERVYSRAPGRAIVRNAGMAYAVFQAWGNDPRGFASDNNKALLDEIEIALASAGSGPFPSGNSGRIEELLGFPGAALARRATWYYKVDGPVHRVVVLDTRTLRDPGSFSSAQPPRLLGNSLDEQLPKGPLGDGRELLFVVSAGPILNPAMLDMVFRPATAAIHDVSNWNREKLREGDRMDSVAALSHDLLFQAGNGMREIESWAVDELHLEEMFDRLDSYGRVVILSGDVHLSCTMHLDYWRRGRTEPSRFVQLTSSGVANSWEPWLEPMFRRFMWIQDLPEGVLVERLGWNGEPGVIVPDDGYIPPSRNWRLGHAPALLPVLGWPAGTEIDPGLPPDWRWRLKLVSDGRPRGERIDADEPPDLAGGDFDPADAFRGYGEVLQRHAIETMRAPRLMRTMVFLPNIAMVGFEASPPGAGVAGHTVVHRILSSVTAEQGRFGFGFNTEHKVPLIPSEAEALALPELVAER